VVILKNSLGQFVRHGFDVSLHPLEANDHQYCGKVGMGASVLTPLGTGNAMAHDPSKKKASLRDSVEKQVTKKSYTVDLRVHSPSALGYFGVEGLDSASALVSLAKVKGLDIIAVSDFYRGDFIDKIQAAAQGKQLTIIPGVDVRCKVGLCDDVHISCLFPEYFTSRAVTDFLEAIKIPHHAAGDSRYIVEVPLERLLTVLEEMGGVALPTRIDKTPYRAQAIPELVERYGFRAFDLAYTDSERYFAAKWPKEKFQLFNFSNAHALAQVGSRIAKVKLPNPGFMGVRHLIERHHDDNDVHA
jgi:PHP family Zn ribbon phosphoesterase